MPFPDSIPVSKVNRKHPEWTALFSYWERLRRLGEGGKTMEDNAGAFLLKRAMEMPDVYQDRLKRFCPIDHFGNIKGWYTSALFKQPPSVVLRKVLASGETTLLGEDDGDEKDQLADFQDNCDGGGKTLVQFWQECVEPGVLTYGKMFVLFDLPAAPNGGYLSIDQQRKAGGLKPHLVAYSPQDAINWQVDEQGNLEWIIFKLKARTQDSPLDDVVLSDRWYIFTRTNVAVYEYVFPKSQQVNATTQSEEPIVPANDQYQSNAQAKLIHEGAHALADQNRVPVFTQTIHTDHWIGKRVAAPLVNLTNLENSHDWSLEVSNLATIVVHSDKDFDQIRRSEAGFLQVGTNDKVSFLEQSGKAFDASDKRINALREEIYRLAYLVAQGRSSTAAAATQSGYSKEQDMMPARDVLSAMGDQVRGAFQTLLQTAADRMLLNVQVDVQGFDFSDRSDVIELEVIQRSDSIATIQSATYQRERDKRLVGIALPDINRETKQTINQEIDTNPTETELQQQQQEQAQAAKLSMFTKMSSPRQFEDAASAA